MDSWFYLVNSALFWSAAGLLFYAYAGYALVSWVHARVHPRTHRRAPLEPRVTVVVVAYNEESRIERRLDNLLALDYPRSRLDIVLASDGSTDRTVSLARRYATDGVSVREFRSRRGKTAVLNDIVPSARGEIVVLADARQRFEPGAVRALVADFADQSVGAVSGELIVMPVAGAAAIGKGASLYWRCEKFIRRNESEVDSTVGATGAIYAIRRSLFEPIAEDTILDDVLIPMRIVGRGYRVLFEPEARAYDSAPTAPQQEFVRKVRTIAGTFQLFARERWLANPWSNRVWFETISHKGLRLVTPVLHAILLIANIGLAETGVYGWLLVAQILFYAAALGGWIRQDRRSVFLLTVPYTICLLNWATVVGFVYFATRRQQVTWERGVPQARPAALDGVLDSPTGAGASGYRS